MSSGAGGTNRVAGGVLGLIPDTRAELAGLNNDASTGQSDGPVFHAADADYMLARGPPPLD